MLSASEKDCLYEIIAGLIGEDPSVKAYRTQFNGTTVDVVENMVAANAQCNASMKDLVTELLGAGAKLSKG